jgi:hypothetical protein
VAVKFTQNSAKFLVHRRGSINVGSDFFRFSQKYDSLILCTVRTKHKVSAWKGWIFTFPRPQCHKELQNHLPQNPFHAVTDHRTHGPALTMVHYSTAPQELQCQRSHGDWNNLRSQYVYLSRVVMWSYKSITENAIHTYKKCHFFCPFISYFRQKMKPRK